MRFSRFIIILTVVVAFVVLMVWFFDPPPDNGEALTGIASSNGNKSTTRRKRDEMGFSAKRGLDRHENLALRPCTVEVRDRLTDRSIPSYSIRLSDNREFLCAKNNVIRIPKILVGELQGIVLLGEDFGPRQPIEFSFDVPPGQGELHRVLHVAAYAGVEVPAIPSTLRQVLVEIYRFPRLEEVLAGLKLTDAEENHLRMSVAYASSYQAALNRFSGHKWPSTKGSLRADSTVVFTKCTGRAVVQIMPQDGHGEYFRMQSRILTLTPGHVEAIALGEFEQKPIVSGRVVDDSGDPVKDVAVTVACRWLFGQSDQIPRMNSEPGGSSIVVWNKQGDRGTHARVYLTMKTGASGNFRMPMPFTGEVAVWTNKTGYHSGYLEPQVVSVAASYQDIRIVVSRRTELPTSTISLQYEDGAPAVNVPVDLRHMSPAHRFNRSYRLVSDKKGILDTSDIAMGSRMIGKFFNRQVHRIQIEAEAEVIVKHPKKNGSSAESVGLFRLR